MPERPWYAVDWRKLALILVIPTALAAAFNVYMRLSPPSEFACVVKKNGEIVKASGEA